MRVETLFYSEQRATRAGLISQRIATQTVVAAQQQLLFRIQIGSKRHVRGGKEHPAERLTLVVLRARIELRILEIVALKPTTESKRVDQILIFARFEPGLQ